MTEYDDYGIPVGAFVEPEDFRGQAWRTARAFYLYRVRPLAWQSYTAVRRADWSFRRWFTLANALVVLWWVVLYWGERGAFDGSIESCSWDRWENWEAGANPHRLIFVADPQLIDPHTYPGRPWPLNPLAYKYTDLYLRRTYSRLQTVLYPDTIFFLGDLFDGGREWSTRTTRSPEERYRRYDDNYWINEYRRFGNIFFKHWGDAGMEPRPGQPGRKLISSLPGNHDLGFARGVQVGVRNRFNAYFGDGNRIDVIANHTFVSIDSLSLNDRNAISVSGGYQYQNVLNKEITVDVANKIGDIRYAFSGDDHDYCEVLHRSYASGGGGIREITVKSTSWAMGVRRPGVVLVSLWNPVDASGKPRSGSADATIRTKLCLFPDQIGTFIRYGMLFGLTFFLLAIRAALVTTGVLKPYTSPPQPNILPTTAQDIKAQQKFEDNPAIEDELSHSSNSSTSSQHKHLLARAKPAKYTYPLIQHAGSYSPPDEEKRREVKIYGSTSSSSTKKAEKKKGVGLWMYEMKWTLGKVLVVGGV
ncbi:hypothetical protein SNOG_04713 [Parastagonospora nodorum SN15]|uniref:Uncharacterized protein n=1 Tax=Phaeosphaeria nodorum (strain SN15 / ATCC MYA-4574 / FGSC 10173) TaxID=321614 RepID=Q0UU51_PHANO|nr:hypothetical protein SNOG_04713 [Parastagonospora nodorum SN15]EAT88473.2 hypothetical protein SNOG_04713 [Parastagonospora nodorum SN15]